MVQLRNSFLFILPVLSLVVNALPAETRMEEASRRVHVLNCMSIPQHGPHVPCKPEEQEPAVHYIVYRYRKNPFLWMVDAFILFKPPSGSTSSMYYIKWKLRGQEEKHNEACLELTPNGVIKSIPQEFCGKVHERRNSSIPGERPLSP
ncbi:hypothetical protein PIIN_08029 [Serendipita indica DSM 11827]|uniref:Uncharacterized protein n=1 Tax=Serendipita indica (strain DSM 11827) TaxID=1109443 RepID=G4TRY2_SERID|nr:hypothetical protein PIIN_08029 [Serendipita indica DSM 11827]